MKMQARTRPGTVVSSAKPKSTPSDPALRLRGWRLWLFRAALVVLAPVLLLLAAEGTLRLVGYGYPVTFFIKSESGDRYITNQKYACQFHMHSTPLKPFLAWLPAQKPPGTIRLCVLGESAAMGTPDPAFGFGRILEAQLRAQYPERRFEVVNAAMRGINSHAIRRIARECADHQIDVFLIYMGNNEVIGHHGPQPGSPGWLQSRAFIRTSHCLRTTKLGQLVQANMGRMKTEPPKQDMASFRAYSLRPDDWRRDRNREHFRANLEDILETATRSGAKVILSTVAANLKDFPPLQSLHRADLSAADKTWWDAAYHQGIEHAAMHQWDEAIHDFQQAEAIDDHFAELHFRLAEAYLAAGDAAMAQTHYSLARDWDALQLRADTKLNRILREVGTRYANRGVALVDIEKAFAENSLSDHGVPGEKLFSDHVHPTFAGNYLLANAMFTPVTAVLGSALGKPVLREPLSQEDCAKAIAYTLYDDLNVTAAMVRMTAGPPFLDQLNHSQRQSALESLSRQALASFGTGEAERCLITYREALRQRPNDWPIHYNLGLFLRELRRFPEAADQLAFVVNEFPRVQSFRLSLAAALAQAGQKSRAIAQLQQARQLEPTNKEVEGWLVALEKP